MAGCHLMTRKPGKPGKYSSELCDKLLPLFKTGRSIVEVSQELGITKKTYHKWKKEHKDWDEATEFAEEAAEAYINSLGLLALKSNGKFKLDTGLYCFTLKTRYKYRETDEKITPDGSVNGQPLTINFAVAPAVGEVIVTNANTET